MVAGVLFGVNLLMSVSCFGQKLSDMEILFNNLTQNYNSHLRPAFNQSEPTKVCMTFHFTNLVDLEEVTGKFSVVGIFDISWNDDQMVWNASEFGGISSILFPQDMVWTPSLLLSNPFNIHSNFLGFRQNKVRFTSDGQATWMPGQIIDATCDIDVTFYPFDTQVCILKYYVWDYNKDEIEIHACSPRVFMYHFSTNGLWTLRNSSQVVQATDDIQNILITIKLQRKYYFFIINMIGPVFMTGILDILVFKMDPNSGERIGYAVSVLLAIAVFLTMLSDSLPNSSMPYPPLICFLLLSDMLMGTCIVLCTVLSQRIHDCKRQRVPCCLATLVKCHMFFFCLELQKKKIRRKIHSIEVKENGMPDQFEEVPIVTWTDVGKLFDAFCFFLFFSWFVFTHFGFAYVLIVNYYS